MDMSCPSPVLHVKKASHAQLRHIQAATDVLLDNASKKVCQSKHCSRDARIQPARNRPSAAHRRPVRDMILIDVRMAENTAREVGRLQLRLRKTDDLYARVSNYPAKTATTTAFARQLHTRT